MPLDMRLIGPWQDGIAGDLTAIVADSHLRPTTLCRQPIKLPGNTSPSGDVPATGARFSRVQSEPTAAAVLAPVARVVMSVTSASTAVTAAAMITIDVSRHVAEARDLEIADVRAGHDKGTVLVRNGGAIFDKRADPCLELTLGVDQSAGIAINAKRIAPAEIEIGDLRSTGIPGEEVEHVLSGAAGQDIEAIAAADDIIAGAAIDNVVAIATAGVIVAEATDDHVVTGAAIKTIVTRAAIKPVIAELAVEDVVAVKSLKGIATIPTEDLVRVNRADEDVVAESAKDVSHDVSLLYARSQVVPCPISGRRAI